MTMRLHLVAVFTAVILFAGSAAGAEEKSLVIGIPGIPPVFSGLQVVVASKAGLFKKYGLDVKVRQFDTGVAAARAVVSGEIDMSVSPTPPIINMVANAAVPVVGIYGMAHPDWLIGSVDASIKTCRDLVGQNVGVDTPGGARATALRQMTAGCIPFDSMKLVSLTSNVGAAMIAGQLKAGVLHIDDIPVIEEQTHKPLTIVVRLKSVKPISEYNFYVVRKDRLALDRKRFVRVLAALIEASNYMYEPKNLGRVAKMATITGRDSAQAKSALKKFSAIEFWARGNDGLGEENVEAEIETQTKVGGIRPGKTAPTYSQLVDRSVWKDAAALSKAMH
jgi:ABC-type nitrate/sulfonate/bicarbonate transport system substrate-binding protein